MKAKRGKEKKRNNGKMKVQNGKKHEKKKRSEK